MALSRPLLVAAVAGALLVVSIGVDASMNVTYALDVAQNGGWQEIATSSTGASDARPLSPDAAKPDANGTIGFRLRVDNGYLWPASDSWDARVNDISYAHGKLSAPPRSGDEVTFSVPKSAWSGNSGGPTPKGVGNVTVAYVTVHVGDKYLSASVQVSEGSS